MLTATLLVAIGNGVGILAAMTRKGFHLAWSRTRQCTSSPASGASPVITA